MDSRFVRRLSQHVIELERRLRNANCAIDRIRQLAQSDLDNGFESEGEFRPVVALKILDNPASAVDTPPSP